MIELQLIAHVGDQLRRAHQQQAKRQFEAGDIVDIQ